MNSFSCAKLTHLLACCLFGFYSSLLCYCYCLFVCLLALFVVVVAAAVVVVVLFLVDSYWLFL